MFTLSKLVWMTLEPSNLLVFMVLAGAILGFTRLWRFGRGLVLAGVIGLIGVGFSPLGTLALRPLEQAFPPLDNPGAVDGIVVLGGALVADISLARGQFSLNEAGERLTVLVDLTRRYPAARIVFTGGAGDLVGTTPSEADALEQVIGQLLPGWAIQYERLSRNTRENAVNAFRLVRPAKGERWLLVTSAWHMPRAYGLFAKAGWDVVAYPVDFRTTATDADLRPFSAISHGLRRMDVAAKEWAGLLFARLTGQTETFWPIAGARH